MTGYRAGDLRRVLDAAAEVFKPEGVTLWINAPNPLLEGGAPIDVLAAGGVDMVLAVLQGLADGVMG